MSRDALVVGINTYQHLRSLNAPAQDAEAIAQRLEQDGEFRVTRLPEMIQQAEVKKPVVAQKTPVSQMQLKRALKRLFLPGSTQAPETALFYFSGHGIPDREGFDKGYLTTSDIDPDNLSTGISLRWLQWLLSESQVKQQIVWLDCCHSGSLIVNVGAANPGNSTSRDRCFIASSRDFESSWEDLNSTYSVLTNALLKGLDPTRLPGRWIDTFALVDSINQALKGELQTPVCTNFGEAINLTRSLQVVDPVKATSASDSGICPYKGLEFFDCNEEDPKYFFGRERLIGQLLDHVRTHNFMALVGASGNGKSSVLRAGLLHQLKLGRRIAGSDQWQILLTRPDAHPMKNLAAVFVPERATQLDRAEALGRAQGLLKERAAGLQRLVQASTAPRVILVIDQFEEVFTRCQSLEEREQFFACLMGALSDTDDKLCLVIAMRADFVGKCLEQEYGGLYEQIQHHLVPVIPMKVEELQAAICKPAEQVGLSIESALVTEILSDIAGAPGSLPLLQYTLKELWQQRQGNQLVLSTYLELGRINGTLDKRATEIYNSFEVAEQQTVRHIFQQLTQLGEGTEDTRRRVFQADLVAEPKHPSERVQQVIERLSNPDKRLLVTSEVVSKGETSERMAIVDVAHEALIRHWQLLRQWIEQNRDLLRQQRKIEASAVAWREQGRKREYLIQGRQLGDAQRFREAHAEKFPLSGLAQDFIRQSQQWQRFNQRKWVALLIIPAIVLDYSLHEFNIRQYYATIDHGRDMEAELNAVLFLTDDCPKLGRRTGYLTERFLGEYCRTLARRNLSNADLSNADLSYANLSYANLSYADLSYANLRDVNLSNANLRSADLRSANLSYADLRSANLKSTTLKSAELVSTNLFAADLSNADLSNTDLSDAFLGNANLRAANLRAANLTSSGLSNANLSNAYLISTDFSNADLSNADLRSTDLSYADLSNAYLSYANLSDSNLSNANLRSTDLSNTDLSDAFLGNANLRDANLRDVNLSNANLRSADLSNADLLDVNLLDADLSNADLSNADLSVTYLRDANLSDVNLSDAILLNTDLRTTQGLTPQQLTGVKHPLICDSLLPEDIEIDRDRDCDALADVLTERYPGWFDSPEQAQEYVNVARKQTWD
ncbi:MAG: pentapeptide repeat-containing protein [Cyanobacteria bacterium J06639_14]